MIYTQLQDAYAEGYNTALKIMIHKYGGNGDGNFKEDYENSQTIKLAQSLHKKEIEQLNY